MTAEAVDKAKLLKNGGPYHENNHYSSYAENNGKRGKRGFFERFVTTVLVAILGISFIMLQYFLPKASHCPTFYTRPYNTTQLCTPLELPDGSIQFGLVAVTDLDHESKKKDAKNTWISYLKQGRLIIPKGMTEARTVWLEDQTILSSQLSAGGRAMELSDLVVFDGKLLSVDDRTGLIYRIEDLNTVIPWVFLNDGPGNTSKSFKAEWSTVRDGLLYIGGLGKEWTTTTGEFENYHPMWVKVISPMGEIQHLDWTENYKKLRRAIGIEWPGYMIHESAQWSDIHQKWFFLPRRASKEQYDDSKDESRGTNVLLIADADFSTVQIRRLGHVRGERGFSAFQFLPGSNDDVIVALKSEEKDGVPVASYLFVYRLSDDRILLNDERFDGPYKFEGLAFI